VAFIASGCDVIDPSSLTLTSSSGVAGASSTWTYGAYQPGWLTCSPEVISTTLTGPPGTVFPASPADYTAEYTVENTTTATAFPTPTILSVSPGKASFSLDVTSIAQGDPTVLSLAVQGVTNPPAGTYASSDFQVTFAYPGCPGFSVDAGTQPNVIPASGLSFFSPAPPLATTTVTSAVWSDQPIPEVYSKPTGEVGQLLFAVLHADGGTAPYTWSLAGGTLPPGVSLYPSGAILGRPTQPGTYSFTARVTDLSEHHVDESVSLDITQ